MKTGDELSYGSVTDVERKSLVGNYKDEPESLPAFVRYKERQTHKGILDAFVKYLFIVCTIVYTFICISFLMSKNVCPLEKSGICPGSTLNEKYNACLSKYSTTPKLFSPIGELNANNKDTGIFALYYKNPFLPLFILLVIPVLAISWLRALYLFSTQIAWLSIILGCVIYIILGVKLEGSNRTSVAWAFIVYGLVTLFVSVAMLGTKVSRAARNLQISAELLQRNVYILVACSVIELIMIVILVFSYVSIVFSYEIWDIVDHGSYCAINVSPLNVRWERYYVIFFMGWLVFFFDGVKAVTTAMSIGTMFFSSYQLEQDDSEYPFQALKTSMTSSLGTIAIGSLIVSTVDRMVRESERKRFWFTSATGCISRFVILYFRDLVAGLNRFALIAHAFTGDGLIQSGNRAYNIMSRNFLGAVVTDQVGLTVLGSAAKGLSVSVMLFTWFLTDKNQGWNTLSETSNLFDGSILGMFLFLAMLLILLEYPLISILLISFFGTTFTSRFCTTEESCEINAPISGLFMGSISRLILNFQASVLLNTMDTVFICYAIGKDKRIQFKDSMLYELVANVQSSES